LATPMVAEATTQTEGTGHQLHEHDDVQDNSNSPGLAARIQSPRGDFAGRRGSSFAEADRLRLEVGRWQQTCEQLAHNHQDVLSGRPRSQGETQGATDKAEDEDESGAVLPTTQRRNRVAVRYDKPAPLPNLGSSIGSSEPTHQVADAALAQLLGTVIQTGQPLQLDRESAELRAVAALDRARAEAYQSELKNLLGQLRGRSEALGSPHNNSNNDNNNNNNVCLAVSPAPASGGHPRRSERTDLTQETSEPSPGENPSEPGVAKRTTVRRMLTLKYPKAPSKAEQGLETPSADEPQELPLQNAALAASGADFTAELDAAQAGTAATVEPPESAEPEPYLSAAPFCQETPAVLAAPLAPAASVAISAHSAPPAIAATPARQAAPARPAVLPAAPVAAVALYSPSVIAVSCVPAPLPAPTLLTTSPVEGDASNSSPLRPRTKAFQQLRQEVGELEREEERLAASVAAQWYVGSLWEGLLLDQQKGVEGLPSQWDFVEESRVLVEFWSCGSRRVVVNVRCLCLCVCFCSKLLCVAHSLAWSCWCPLLAHSNNNSNNNNNNNSNNNNNGNNSNNNNNSNNKPQTTHRRPASEDLVPPLSSRKTFKNTKNNIAV
ncbi:unnamed protein product, partial [Polarella glacialis]